MKRAIIPALLVLSLVILSTSVLAFTASIKTIDNEIYGDERAQFELTIKNNDEEDDHSFTISSLDVVNWDIYTSPRSRYVLTLGPDSEETITVYVQPLGGITGAYTLQLTIKDTTENSKVTKDLNVNVIDADDPRRLYIPSLTTEIIMDKGLDPTDTNLVKVKVRNLIPRTLEGVDISLRSNSGLVMDSEKIDLQPKEERLQVFLVNFDPLQEPIEDVMKATITYTDSINRTYNWVAEPVRFNINEYSTIAKTEKEDKSFFKKEVIYNFKNLGNVENTYEFTMEKGFFKDIFFSSDPKPTVSKDYDKRTLVWTIELQPDESIEVKAVTNYRILIYLLILAIICTVLYYWLRSPIIVEKTAVAINKKAEGMSELKIKIFVKNRSSKTFENINIVDKIPKIAEIGKDFHVGTIKPTEIVRHGKSSTIVKWALSHLEAYEERLITYNMASKLTIIGGLTLPNTILKYKAEDNQVKKVYSNSVLLR